jgi:hypothetical protein
MDFRKTKFKVELSNKPDRLYVLTMTNGKRVLQYKDDKVGGDIVDITQGIAGFFRRCGAQEDEVYKLIHDNVRLAFNLEDMFPHDPKLREIAENFGFAAVYDRGL